jgi:hypothetical protein
MKSSDKLFNAEVDSMEPGDIFQLMRAQLAEELPSDKFNDGTDLAIRADELEAIEIAEQIYAEYDDDIAFRMMQASDLQRVREIGEALESGEYSGLAI